jgi:hypothetical protein
LPHRHLPGLPVPRCLHREHRDPRRFWIARSNQREGGFARTRIAEFRKCHEGILPNIQVEITCRHFG